MEQVFTIAGCRSAAADSRSHRSAALATRTMSSSLSSTVPWAPMPALFTTMSIPPMRSAASATAAATESSATSALMPINGSGTPDGSRSRQATSAPRAASNRAAASPIPEPPPVTIARKLLNSVITHSGGYPGVQTREEALPSVLLVGFCLAAGLAVSACGAGVRPRLGFVPWAAGSEAGNPVGDHRNSFVHEGEMSSLVPPHRSRRIQVGGDRIRVQLSGETGRARRGVTATGHHDRVDEVLVQVVHVLDHAILGGAA